MSVFLLVVKFVPLLISIVQAMDQAFPQAGFGPFKLGLALSILRHIGDVMKGGAVTLDSLIGAAPVIIGDVVTAMNAKPETWVPVAAPVVAPVVVVPA